MGNLLRFLLLSCAIQAAGAQGLFKGFIPDENGTNLDGPRQQKKALPGTIIKDCVECPEMVVIPAGSFFMGSNKNSAEQPRHSVKLSSFLLGETEVTQAQWTAVMGKNPSFFSTCGTKCPVENVSWNDVQEFIRKLTEKTGQRYRLPSEAEWEYAARAGTATEWSHGNDESKLGQYAWYDENGGGATNVVGQKMPNSFGLFDMYGNVMEWTEDCWHDTYAGAPTDGSAWTTNCNREGRVARGGGWFQPTTELRSAWRSTSGPIFGVIFSGFRLARDL